MRARLPAGHGARARDLVPRGRPRPEPGGHPPGLAGRGSGRARPGDGGGQGAIGARGARAGRSGGTGRSRAWGSPGQACRPWRRACGRDGRLGRPRARRGAIRTRRRTPLRPGSTWPRRARRPSSRPSCHTGPVRRPDIRATRPPARGCHGLSCWGRPSPPPLSRLLVGLTPWDRRWSSSPPSYTTIFDVIPLQLPPPPPAGHHLPLRPLPGRRGPRAWARGRRPPARPRRGTSGRRGLGQARPRSPRPYGDAVAACGDTSDLQASGAV